MNYEIELRNQRRRSDEEDFDIGLDLWLACVVVMIIF